MSVYQYYEFAAVDRPLDAHALAAVRALSTRAHITPTSFVNTYHWGDFRGDPRRLVERYYDAFLYLANWGTRQLMLRFPARLLDLDTARRYCPGDLVSAWDRAGQVIVGAVSEDEEGDFDHGGEGLLASILPVRAEVLAGDHRGLYLLWLAAVRSGEVPGEELEPPVPAGLGALTGSQAALAEFLRVDPDLLDVAAAGAGPYEPVGADVATWVAGLGAGERDALLVGLLRGGDPLLRAETLRRIAPDPVGAAGQRRVEQLLAAAEDRGLARERAERERRERAAAERAQQVAAARRRRLDTLAAEGELAWGRVATRIAEKKAAGYDAAVQLLIDLCEVCPDTEFHRRVAALRVEHRNKPALMQRLASAGL